MRIAEYTTHSILFLGQLGQRWPPRPSRKWGDSGRVQTLRASLANLSPARRAIDG